MNTETKIAIVLGLLEEEQLEPISRLAKAIPPQRGKRRCTDTLRKWIVKGLRSRNGETIKLEYAWGPGRSYWSSRPALARFFVRLEGREEAPRPVPSGFERRAKAACDEFDREMAKGKKRNRGRRRS
jgi:hypothetical protein